MSSTSSSWRSGPSAGSAALGGARGDVQVLAGGAVVDRQPVPPPQLARDAPRADVLHPVEVHAAVVVGDDPHAAVAHGVDRGRGELVHAHEPLQRDQRLDPLARSGGSRGLRAVGLLPHDPTFLAQRGDHRRARLHHRQPGEALARLGGHPPVLADHRHLVELVAAADLEVVGVVRRGDLQRAGAEVRLHVLVGDDRQAAADERQDRRRARPARGSARPRGAPRRRCRRASSPGARSRSSTAPAALQVVADRVQRVGLARAPRPRGRRSPSGEPGSQLTM